MNEWLFDENQLEEMWYDWTRPYIDELERQRDLIIRIEERVKRLRRIINEKEVE